MKKTRNRLICAAAAAVVAMGTAVGSAAQIIPMYANAGQQLGQTDFEDGAGLPWHICESAPGEMDFDISNGVYKITIINPGGASKGGEDRWDCQFRHRGLKIDAGHQYKVSYEITSTNSGKYYTKIGNLDGDVEVWHNMSTNSGDFGGNWDCLSINANETKKVELTFTPIQSLDVAEWAFHLGGDGQYTPGGCFPAGTVITFDNMSLIDLTSDENDYVHPEKWQRADILTNQVGYFTKRAKKATLLCDSDKAVKFEVLSESGKSVFSGKSEPFGLDRDSGDRVHILDFSKLDKEGTYTIKADNGAVSREFTVGGSDTYSGMLYDALNYFYQNRSGIEIESALITSGDAKALARAAGHPKDMAEIQQTWGYSGSSGTIDVTGGWYDAGDHGKYVVNGGFSLWMLQNQYETALTYGFADKFADGTMNIPENTNGFPDLLDEARWEMEWMFSMVVDSGQYKDMVYHKAHDEKWTALGIAPADDDMKRIVKPPTTAATLNFAACAAQAARLWKGIDDKFADKCLKAAKASYDAAQMHPDMYAPLDESVGGGAYGDSDVDDEFCWAATELYITTGEKKYRSDAEKTGFFMELPTNLGGGESVDSVGSFDWGNVGALGTISAALNEKAMDKSDYKKAVATITQAAQHYIGLEEEQGYGMPYGQSTLSYNDPDKGYLWGSNSFVADNAVVLAMAYLITGEDKYMDGALGGVDYLLGRNAMDYSYVTGYGSHAIEFPHHRYWANQIDDSFPKAPCGVMCGGPNSGMQDPWVQGSGWKKGAIAPQKCYLDHIEAWSVNECTINWNASLAWLIGFAAQENGGIKIGSTGHSANISNDGGKGESNSDQKYKDTTVNKQPDREIYDDEPDVEREKVDIGSGGLLPIVIVIGVVILLIVISVLIFIYKLVKLKYDNQKPKDGGNTQ